MIEHCPKCKSAVSSTATLNKRGMCAKGTDTSDLFAYCCWSYREGDDFHESKECQSRQIATLTSQRDGLVKALRPITDAFTEVVRSAVNVPGFDPETHVDIQRARAAIAACEEKP